MSVSEYEHVPVLLVTIVVFRANYQYISLDSMEKFLSYASNGISISIESLSYEPKEASSGVQYYCS